MSTRARLAVHNQKAGMSVMFIIGSTVCLLVIASLSDAPYIVNALVSTTGGVIAALLTLTTLALCYGDPDDGGSCW